MGMGRHGIWKEKELRWEQDKIGMGTDKILMRMMEMERYGNIKRWEQEQMGMGRD